ncbi:MAG TPA: HAD-IB family phosphatase [Longimicrobiales bacterium]
MRFATVVFDCDSTLTAVEGIDELAGPQRARIEALTDEAMRGLVPLEVVYGRRLELVRPTKSRVIELGKRYIEALVPDALETVTALRAEGIGVRIMSGGLKPAVAMLAAHLGVAEDAIDAVAVHFSEDGGYSGFDAASPLAQSGGKRTVIESWGGRVARPLMLVGDGATDQEAQPSVDAFVAFAGVVYRAGVVTAADVVIRERSLAPVVPLALGGQPPRSAAAKAIFQRGLSLLGTNPKL